MVIGRLVFAGGKLGVQTFDRQMHFDCAVVIIQRYMEDWVPDAITSARMAGQVIVNDVDDWFWGLHPDNTASLAVDPTNSPKSNIDHYRRSLEASNAVTVSTPFLRDAISQWGVQTHLIPNGVTTWHFTPRVHKPGPVTIGWCGSTGHRSGDLEIVAPALQKVAKQVKFHHTGSFDLHPTFATKTGLNARAVSTLPLLAPSDYPFGFVFDIGIVPLSDVVFNIAKSWIKGIEYAAAGIPFIASDMDEYKRLHNKYGIGRLASTTDEWVAHFEELLDPTVRHAEAQRAREIVDKELDARLMAKKWDDLAWGLL
jgi:glycosyltransferase involved in cell wall biosynthesis